MQALLGIPLFLLLAWLLRERRGPAPWRLVIMGLGAQCLLALLLLKVRWITEAFLVVNELVYAVEAATRAGTSFVFGHLGGGPAPFEVRDDGLLYLFAFRVLPQILLFSVLVALLWYWRILPTLVRLLSSGLRRLFGIGGALGIGAAASMFLGMVESPLVVRAYLARFSRSELFTLMTCGMATVAGSIMVLYASVLNPVVPGALGHVLAASLLNVIGAIYVGRLLVPPEPGEVPADGANDLRYESHMDAINRGAMDGLRLAVNVGAMLVVFVSLVALVNQMIDGFTVAGAPLTLERIFGWGFAPAAWLMGIPWAESQIAGSLLGAKVILNEVVAYLELARQAPDALSASSRLILTYALCGFANFGSLGILLAGLTTLAPDRRREILAIAPKSILSGTLVTLITGALVGLISRLPF